MTLVTKPFGDIITFTRASGGGRFNASGVYEWLGNNVPRFDYDPVTLQPRGLLIEEQRTNLLTFSSEIDNAVWVKTSITITPNVIAAPDGSISGDKVVETASASAHGPGRGFTTVAGATYAFSLVCKAGERHVVQLLTSVSGFSEQVFCNFNLNTGLVGLKGTGVTATINPLGGGWYRCSISMLATSSVGATFAAYMQLSDEVPRGQNYAGDGTSGIYIWGAQLEAGAYPTSYIPTPSVFTSRASTATYFDSNGVLQTAAIDTARYDHRFIDGQWKPCGLLIEEQRTNLLTYSSDFASGGWLRAATEVTTGETLAGIPLQTLTETGASAYVGRSTLASHAGTQMTLSRVIKRVNHDWVRVVLSDSSSSTNRVTAWFNLATGKKGSLNTTGVGVSNISSDIIPLGQGVYRCVVSATLPGTSANTTTASASGDNITERHPGGVRLEGAAQLEAGAYPTSYIPTTTAQVTRAADVSTSSQVTRSADVASVNTLSPWYNASEGTLFVEYSRQWESSPSQGRVAYLSGLDSSKVIQIRAGGAGSALGTITDSGVVNADIQSAILSMAGSKVALSWSAVGASLAANGTLYGEDISVVIPQELTTLWIGSSFGNTQLRGHIRTLRYWPRRLSNAELQQVTA